MADSPAKRAREAKKRQHREEKAERKRLRKAGLLNVGQAENPAQMDVPAGPPGPTSEPPQQNP